MSRFIQVLNATLLLLLIGFVGVVFWWFWGVRLSLADTIVQVHDAAVSVKNVSGAVDKAMAAETKRIDASTLEFQKTEAASRLLIVRTNASINGSPDVRGLLPELTKVVASGDVLVRQAGDDLQRVSDRLTPILSSAGRAADSAAVALGNPAIQHSLEHLDEATASVAASAQHIDTGTASMAAIAKDGQDVADKFRNDYMKPQKFAWQLLKELVGLGGSFAQMVK
jgi:methyl-accepting chemotaxis protein